MIHDLAGGSVYGYDVMSIMMPVMIMVSLTKIVTMMTATGQEVINSGLTQKSVRPTVVFYSNVMIEIITKIAIYLVFISTIIIAIIIPTPMVQVATKYLTQSRSRVGIMRAARAVKDLILSATVWMVYC